MDLSLNKSQVTSFGQWIQPPLSGTFWCHWKEAEHLDRLFLENKFHGFIFLNGHHIIENKDVTIFNKITQKIVSKNDAERYTKLLNSLGNDYEQKHLEVLALPKETRSHLPRLFETYKNAVGLWWFCIPLGEALESYIRENWPQVPNDLLFELTKPLKPTWLEIQSRELLELTGQAKALRIKKLSATTLKKYPVLAKKMLKHVEKFVWFGTHHWMGAPYNLKRCLEEINHGLNIKSEEAKKFPGKPPVPSHIVKLARTISYWRTHCAELTAKVVFLSRPVLNTQAKKWKISYQDLTYLSHIEILKFLNDPSLPKSYGQKIKLRKQAYGCLLDQQANEHIYTGRQYSKLLRRLIESNVKDMAELKGVVACKGLLTRAQACVIMEPKNFKNFKNGMILVTNETSPDFIPLIKKASAVITDVGGITSHAAIVCRELGKPCIIGTKHATQIFKNGDIIEVDTEKGIVKKINEHKKL